MLLPADGVYGLCASAFSEAPVRRLYELKGRGAAQPTAMIASSVDMLLECVPELRGRTATIVARSCRARTRSSSPNPARRYPWLNGDEPGDDRRPGRRAADATRSTCSTRSAPSPRRARTTRASLPPASLDDVPARIRDGCGAEVDAGALSGEPSTVLDLTGDEPRVLREGAGLRRASALAAGSLRL